MRRGAVKLPYMMICSKMGELMQGCNWKLTGGQKSDDSVILHFGHCSCVIMQELILIR